jgi:hypothetical protein
VTEAEAPKRVKTIYEDIMQTMDVPIINTDYQALARWPDYLEMGWSELTLIVRSEPYRILRGKMDVYTTTMVKRFPYAIQADRQDLQARGISSREIDQITNLIRQFQAMFPGLILNITALKLAMEKGWVRP